MSATATEIKERPILFTGPMVRAILGGTKTQTRRLVKNPDRLNGLMLAGEEPDWCPYGQPGDRLWVRETQWRNGGYVATDKHNFNNEGKKPSIFMKRFDSRLTLEVVSVRVERVQEIREDDAIAEGMEPKIGCAGTVLGWRSPAVGLRISVVDAFQDLWDLINAKRAPWASNPWVWVVEFKKIEA